MRKISFPVRIISVFSDAFIPAIKVIIETFREFSRDDGTNLAASISFYLILSFVPFLLLSASVFGYFLGSSETLFDDIMERIRIVLPFLEGQLVEALRNTVAGKGALGGSGILILVWSVNRIFVSTANVLNRIFQIESRRGFLMNRLITIGLALGLGISLVLSVGVGVITGVVENTRFGILGIHPGTILNHPLVRYAIPFWLLVASFSVLIVILPHGKVYFRYALLGGGMFAGLFELAKNIFTGYILKISKVSVIYGSFGSLVVIILWVFYLSVLFIFSAEFVSVTQRLGEEKRMKRSLEALEGSLPSGGARE